MYKIIPARFLTGLTLLFFGACQQREAHFKVSSANFGNNSSVAIYPEKAKSSVAALNLNNTAQDLVIPYPEPGYHYIQVSTGKQNPAGRLPERHLIYLQGGNYTLKADTNVSLYPVVDSDVPEQNELTAYYRISDSISRQVNQDLAKLRRKAENTIFLNISDASAEDARLRRIEEEAQLVGLEAFAKKFPASQHTAYLLNDLDLADRFPKTYLRILSLTDAQVQANKLAVKSAAAATDALGMELGQIMPDIVGHTPAGEKFDRSKHLSKVNLIIVWTSYDRSVRAAHKELKRLYEANKNRGLQIISVSLDKDQKWWRSAIEADQLPWPQFSDLQGAKSPNARKLSARMHPYCFIVDKQGKIVVNKVLISEAAKELKPRL